MHLEILLANPDHRQSLRDVPCSLESLNSGKLRIWRTAKSATTSCRFKMSYCSDMTLAGPFTPRASLVAAPIPLRWDVTRPSISPYCNATLDSPPCRLAATTAFLFSNIFFLFYYLGLFFCIKSWPTRRLFVRGLLTAMRCSAYNPAR
ncbi:hypothetical protein HZ326_18706 [Fusarium oxysporum f. sp. albedinis]|nr:hypothetical protein HZ326_18706 [Fusarium oxysporum f. sp. albedinis]